MQIRTTTGQHAQMALVKAELLRLLQMYEGSGFQGVGISVEHRSEDSDVGAMAFFTLRDETVMEMSI